MPFNNLKKFVQCSYLRIQILHTSVFMKTVLLSLFSREVLKGLMKYYVKTRMKWSLKNSALEAESNMFRSIENEIEFPS